jgi:hypothetical protein
MTARRVAFGLVRHADALWFVLAALVGTAYAGGAT